MSFDNIFDWDSFAPTKSDRDTTGISSISDENAKSLGFDSVDLLCFDSFENNSNELKITEKFPPLDIKRGNND